MTIVSVREKAMTMMIVTANQKKMMISKMVIVKFTTRVYEKSQ